MWTWMVVTVLDVKENNHLLKLEHVACWNTMTSNRTWLASGNASVVLSLLSTH